MYYPFVIQTGWIHLILMIPLNIVSAHKQVERNH